MMTALSHLSNADLLSSLRESLFEERERLVFQLKHLAEELGMDESSAYRRIQAANFSRDSPISNPLSNPGGSDVDRYTCRPIRQRTRKGHPTGAVCL